MTQKEYYRLETGYNAETDIALYEGNIITVYTDDYVEWLERKIIEKYTGA